VAESRQNRGFRDKAEADYCISHSLRVRQELVPST
jgi:hypothetical protein